MSERKKGRVMTDQQLFEVVFRGDIRQGERLAAVRQRLGDLFRLDFARLDQLFSGRPVVLRRGLTQGDAERFRALLEEAGALIQLRPGSVALADPESPATSDSESAAQEPSAPEPSLEEPSLAPLGADLLRPDERPQIEVPTLSLEHLSLAELGSDVLRPEERQRSAPRSLDVSHLSVSL